MVVGGQEAIERRPKTPFIRYEQADDDKLIQILPAKRKRGRPRKYERVFLKDVEVKKTSKKKRKAEFT
jgi:hypothetical protein